MTETIKVAMDRLMTISAELRITLQKMGCCTVAAATHPRKRFSRTVESCLGVTAIRLNACAGKR